MARHHNKGGGFFDKPMFRTVAALATLGGSEIARAGVKAARGEKVNVGRALLGAATLGGSELAYGAGVLKDKSGRKPSPEVAAMVARTQAAARAPASHLDPPPGKLYPQRKHVGRAIVGVGHVPHPGRAPAPNHPAPGRAFPERKLAGRRVVRLPDSAA